MSKKKIAEIVVAIVFTLVVIAALGWFFYTIQKSQNSSTSSNNSGSSLELSKVPLTELKSAEFGPLIIIKNLRKFGEIPVVVSGGERSKANPFLADDTNSQSATASYTTDNFSVGYPPDWSKTTNKNQAIEFRSPLEDGTTYAHVTTDFQPLAASAQGQSSVETALKLYATSKVGVEAKDLDKYVEETTNKTTSSYGGRIAYSYKLGDQIRKGWIFAQSFTTPSQEITNNLFKLIQDNKEKSKYLTQIATDINNSIQSASTNDSRDKTINSKLTDLLKEKQLIEELNYLGQNITYNTTPFQGILILNYETDLDHFDKYAENAKFITQQITFEDTVTLPSISASPSETTQLETGLPPAASE